MGLDLTVPLDRDWPVSSGTEKKIKQDQHTIIRKKLIEVVLSLEAINKASAREKSIRHSHP
jgi:hypothetical protein